MNPDDKQSPKHIPVSRMKIGIITVICWACALFLYLFYQDEAKMMISGFTRVGLLMSALWIAFPTDNREAAWAGISLKTAYAWGLILLAIILRVPFRFIAIGLVVWWGLHTITKPFFDALKSEEKNE